MNVTSKQKEMLLQFLKKNPDVVRGRINRKAESRRKMVEIWDKIAHIINAAAVGPRKSGKEWAKTWKDIKAYILKKESKRRSHMEGTGGGPPSKIVFSNFEEEVLELLTSEAAGLLNIPEGGINIAPAAPLLNIPDGDDMNIEAPLQNIPEGGINIEGCILNFPEDDISIDESALNEYERDTEEMAQIEPQGELFDKEINNVENANASSNILKHQKEKSINKYARNIAAENINRKTKENSRNELSHNMLKIQQKKYKLKKRQLKLVKTALNMQHEILSELKNIKISIQSWESLEIL